MAASSGTKRYFAANNRYKTDTAPPPPVSVRNHPKQPMGVGGGPIPGSALLPPNEPGAFRAHYDSLIDQHAGIHAAANLLGHRPIRTASKYDVVLKTRALTGLQLTDLPTPLKTVVSTGSRTGKR